MKYRLSTQGKVLLASTLMLSAVGVVMVYSASLPVAQNNYQDGYFFFKRHFGHLSLGVSLMFLAWLGLRSKEIDLRKWVYPATFLGLILLAAVLYSPWGLRVRGAQRWLGWAGFSFQAVEITKFCLLICLAHFLARLQEKPKQENYYFLGLALVILSALYLLIRQPDLGNTLILVGVSFILLFLAEIELIYLVSLALLATSATVLWLARASYVQQRLLAFIDPWKHADQGGFQIVQSFLAIGNGGLWGTGLGAGQQKVGHLPEAHTDFILAVIGEEWGLIGAGMIIVLFVAFVWAGLMISTQMDDLFTGYLTAGITSLIGLQAMFNIWVVTGLFPTKGLPLPFISYGGTSLVASLMGVGVLLAFASKRLPQKRKVWAGSRLPGKK